MVYQPNYKYIPPLNRDFLTPIYDTVNGFIGLGKRFLRKVLAVIEIQNGHTVLDIGCGTGVLLALGKQRYPHTRFIGIDPDTQALSIAKNRFAKNNLEVELVQAFAESIPLPDSSIDRVVSSLVFHHLPDEIKCKAIQEIYRILKPGGKVVIADFGPTKVNWMPKLLHLFENIEYLKGSLQGLIPAYLRDTGFTSVKVIAKYFPGTNVVQAIKSSNH